MKVGEVVTERFHGHKVHLVKESMDSFVEEQKKKQQQKEQEQQKQQEQQQQQQHQH